MYRIVWVNELGSGDAHVHTMEVEGNFDEAVTEGLRAVRYDHAGGLPSLFLCGEDRVWRGFDSTPRPSGAPPWDRGQEWCEAVWGE